MLPPGVSVPHQDCALIRTVDRFLDESYCIGSRYGYLCQRKGKFNINISQFCCIFRLSHQSVSHRPKFAGVCKPSSNCVTVGNYNFTDDDSVTWYDARDTCRWSGTDLAVFGGQNEINAVMSKLSSLNLKGHYWIGLTRIKWKSG